MVGGKVENGKDVSHFPTHPATAAAGCSHKRIMVDVGAESMVGGTIFGRRSPPQVISVRFPESWSSTSLAKSGAKNTDRILLSLTPPSLLSRGTRSWDGFGSLKAGPPARSFAHRPVVSGIAMVGNLHCSSPVTITGTWRCTGLLSFFPCSGIGIFLGRGIEIADCPAP